LKESLNSDGQQLQSGTGNAHPSGTPEFTPVFSRVRVTRSLVLCVCFVDRCWISNALFPGIFFMFNYLGRELIVRFVDVGGKKSLKIPKGGNQNL
jgi:hypothetical protein